MAEEPSLLVKENYLIYRWSPVRRHHFGPQ